MTGAPVDATSHEANERPRLLERFAYRALGWKLDHRFRHWIADDVRSGRALRWRWVTCGVMVVGTQLLIRAAFAARGGTSAPVAATLVGAFLGLVIGTQIVKRQGPEVRVAKYLRYQGLLPDGRRDPNPRGFARFDNYGVAAMQLATIAFLGLVAGYLPVRIIPVPAGRCVAPPEASLSPIREALRPGVEVRSVRAVRHRGITYIAGTTGDGQAVSWQQIKALGGLVQGTGSSSAAVTPSLGASTSGGGDDQQGYDEALRKAEACSRAAAAAGASSPVLLVRPPTVEAALGTLRVSGAATFDLAGLTASCNAGTSAMVQTGTSELGLIVSSPQMFLTVASSGTAPTSYTGTIGAVDSGVVLIDGTLKSLGVGGSRSEVRVTGRIPCTA